MAQENDKQNLSRRWPKLFPLVVTAIAIIVLIYLLIEAFHFSASVIEPVFIPLLISLALAYMMEPMVVWFERRKISRSLATFLTILLSGTGIAMLLLFLIPNFLTQVTDILSRLPRAVQSTGEWIRPKLAYLQGRDPVLYEKISGQITEFINDPNAITEPVANFAKRAFLQIGGITASVLNLILIPLFVYYILADFPTLRKLCNEAIPPRNRAVMSDLFQQVDSVLRNFVRGQLIVCTLMSLLYTTIFLILGVPMSFTLGFLSGFGHLVPYIGTGSAAILVIGLTALNAPEWWRLMFVALAYPTVQGIEGFVLTPKILGEKLELHPFVVLAGIIIFHHLFGILGIALAAPVMACIKIFIIFFYNRYLQSDFYLRSSMIIHIPSDGLRQVTANAEMPSELIAVPDNIITAIKEETQEPLIVMPSFLSTPVVPNTPCTTLPITSVTLPVTPSTADSNGHNKAVSKETGEIKGEVVEAVKVNDSKEQLSEVVSAEPTANPTSKE